MCGGATPDHPGNLAGVEVECCLLLRIVLQDALDEVTKIYPLLKLRVFVDGITALDGQEQGSGRNGKEGYEEVERGFGEKELEIVDRGEGIGRKE